MAFANPKLGYASAGLAYRRQRSWAVRIATPLIVLTSFVVVASAGYWVIEREYTWLESLYMTVITVATVGFHEVHPLSHWGQVWTIFVIVTGLVIGTVVLSLVASMVVEGRVRTIFGRRQLQRKIESLSGHVIVCGFGRMGALVGAELAAAGRDLVVVETDAQRTEAAEAAGLLYLLGDAQQEEILKTAGLAKASALVAVLPGDAENVFVTLTARQLNSEVVIIARAQNASAQDKLQKAGASRVVCPQIIGASRVVDVLLRPAVVDFVEMAHKGVDLEMDQLLLSEQSELAGKSLRELGLPQRVGVHVVAVRHGDGRTVYHPSADLQLETGDTLVLVGPRGVASAVQQLQAQSDQP